jgi:hypothetical protein
MGYRIIVGQSPEELERKVNQQLSEGDVPVGSIAVGSRGFLYQAIFEPPHVEMAEDHEDQEQAEEQPEKVSWWRRMVGG